MQDRTFSHECFGLRDTTKLPHSRGMVKICSCAGAGDGRPNRVLSCSHPRIAYRLTKCDAGLPLSKDGYLSQHTPRISPIVSRHLHQTAQAVGCGSQAVIGVFRAMSQIKPASSRAMAANDGLNLCGIYSILKEMDRSDISITEIRETKPVSHTPGCCN